MRWLLVPLLWSSIAAAQLSAPSDEREAKLYEQAGAAAAKAGIEGAVLWHGQGRWERWLLVGALGDPEGKLALVVLPRGKGAPTVLPLGSLERLSGGLDVEVQPLLERPEVVDLVIARRPFQLESTTTRVTHDLVATTGNPAHLCHLDGSRITSTGMGPEAWTDRYEVTLEPIAGARPPALRLTTKKSRTVRKLRDGAETRTDGASATRRIEIVDGKCEERAGG